MIFKPTKENAIFSQQLLEYYFSVVLFIIISVIRNRELIPLVNKKYALIFVSELSDKVILENSRKTSMSL